MGVARGFISISRACPVAASIMKSKPRKPDSPSASTIATALARMPGWSITRSTVAGPPGVAVSSTSAPIAARTRPWRQTTARLAGRPVINSCASTAGRCHWLRMASESRLPSRNTAAQARARLGRRVILCHAAAASARPVTTATPLPPQLPSLFSSSGWLLASRSEISSSVSSLRVAGIGNPSRAARAICADLLQAVAYPAGSPRLAAMMGAKSARARRPINVAAAISSVGTNASGRRARRTLARSSAKACARRRWRAASSELCRTRLLPIWAAWTV